MSLAPCNDCKKCISFGTKKTIIYGRTCSENVKETRTNLWKRGNILRDERFTSNTRRIRNINEICLHKTTYLDHDASGWIRGIHENYDTLKLEMIGTETANSGIFNITSSTPQHRGFSYIYKQIYGDDSSINQIVIHDASVDVTFDLENNGTEDDDLDIGNLSGSDIIAFVVLYGDDDANPIASTDISKFVERYIDNVIYNGNILATISEMCDNFTNNFTTILGDLSLYVNFEYPGLSNNFFTLEGATGTNLSVEIKIDENHNYVFDRVNNPGSGYTVGEIISVTGINNAPSDFYEATFTILETNDVGGATGVDVSGTAYIFQISDGGDDQYDGGNQLNNDFNTRIPYTLGTVVDDVFGSGSKYFTKYRDSIFTMIATGNKSDRFYLTGNLGADGYGDLDGGKGILNSTCLSVERVSGSGVINKKEICEFNILPK